MNEKSGWNFTIYHEEVVASLLKATADQKVHHSLDQILIDCMCIKGPKSSLISILKHCKK